MELLERFWAHIGLDDEDYAVGYVAEPNKTWLGTCMLLLLCEKDTYINLEKERVRSLKNLRNPSNHKKEKHIGFKVQIPILIHLSFLMTVNIRCLPRMPKNREKMLISQQLFERWSTS